MSPPEGSRISLSSEVSASGSDDPCPDDRHVARQNAQQAEPSRSFALAPCQARTYQGLCEPTLDVRTMRCRLRLGVGAQLYGQTGSGATGCRLRLVPLRRPGGSTHAKRSGGVCRVASPSPPWRVQACSLDPQTWLHADLIGVWPCRPRCRRALRHPPRELWGRAACPSASPHYNGIVAIHSVVSHLGGRPAHGPAR